MIGFLIFAITDFAGLVWSPALVVPGIQGIESGSTVNSGIDFQGNWTANPWNGGSILTYQNAGGNPGGFLEMTLPGSGAKGYWMQSFRVAGAVPFTAAVRLDIQIVGGLTAGRLMVSVDSAPTDPDPAIAIGNASFSGPIPWTNGFRFDASSRITDPGVYYLKVAFVVDQASGSVDVGFDNVRLTWTTDAAVVVYVPLPAPVAIFVSQDKSLFLAYFGFIVLAILVAAGYYAIRERKETIKAIVAPLEAVYQRLRSRSAWIAIGQTWMAVTFFQIVFIVLVTLVGINPTSPIPAPTAKTAWVLLYELGNAGVYEEFAFRLLLIGLPMALGSVILRIMEVNRGGMWNGRGSAGRHIAGAWRYLIGGVVRSDSPRETVLASWVFLVASSAIFGLAHAPGWGSWKVIPAAVAGLGFGYLFLRYGIGAAILAHFVNDYAFALTYEGIGGTAFELLLTLLFVFLAVAGAGFFVWYLIRVWQSLTGLVTQFRPPIRARPLPSSSSTPYAAPSPPPFSSSAGYPAPVPPNAVWPASQPPATSPIPPRDPGHLPRDYSPSYIPPPYGYPPVRFQCPFCGWVEARYDAGRFTCTRCGRTA